MKTGQVARDMLKDQQTIVAWSEADEFRAWFSEKARGLQGQRDFNDTEYDIINTIRDLRNQNKTYRDIAIEIEGGYRSTETPPGLATRQTVMPATVYANQVALSRENEQLRQHIVELEASKAAEITRLNQELQTTVERLMNARNEAERGLNREIGRLENKVEMLQEQLEELKQSRK